MPRAISHRQSFEAERVSAEVRALQELAAQPSLLERMRASLDSKELDPKIAIGAATSGDRRLTARAWQLTRMRTRQHLADALERVVFDSDDELYRGGRDSGLAHREVRAARAELSQLIARLRDRAPVKAPGVARVAVLVADNDGPLYVAGDRDGLWRQVLAAREALD
jgi:hypothetical protein